MNIVGHLLIQIKRYSFLLDPINQRYFHKSNIHHMMPFYKIIDATHPQINAGIDKKRKLGIALS